MTSRIHSQRLDHRTRPNFVIPEPVGLQSWQLPKCGANLVATFGRAFFRDKFACCRDAGGLQSPSLGPNLTPNLAVSLDPRLGQLPVGPTGSAFTNLGRILWSKF